jgi:serine/threonine-protein kinase
VDEDWRMEFAYPSTQRLTDPARPVAQNGRKVVVRGSADLRPGRSVSVELRGEYRGANPLPIAFRLDGHRCEAEVIGATSITIVEKASNAGSGGGRPQKSAPPPSPSADRTEPRSPKKPVRKPARSSPPPTPNPSTAEPRRVGGFSVAV